MKSSFIKFIIPCYNCGHVVGKMLDSILGQTFRKIHIVCVDDCSTDNTLSVLQDYAKRFPDMVTVIHNRKNLGPGRTRNVGYYKTISAFPSDFIWMVDADDALANENVVQDIHGFLVQNPKMELVNVGFMWGGRYILSGLLVPHALWGVVVKSSIFVPFMEDRISNGEDIYVHFILFDKVDDDKIGYFDHNCYLYSGDHYHIISTAREQRNKDMVKDGLSKHKFRKKDLENFLFNEFNYAKKWLGFEPSESAEEKEKKIITANDLLEHSFVITVDEQRYALFKKVFAHHNLFPLPRRFDGVQDKENSGVQNCYLSHRAAILKAKELNWPYVLIFEDDAYPCIDARTHIDRALANIPLDCKVLTLGCSFSWDMNGINQFFDSAKTWGAHAYVVFRAAYDEYVGILDEYKVADWAFSMEDCPVRPITSKKNIFIQYTIGGNISGHEKNIGYVYYGKNRRHFGITEAMVRKLGFPLIEDIIK